jgi:hypothetical protein
MADVTATATLVLAAIALALVLATAALVVVTRAGTRQAQDDARAQLELLRRQLWAGHRPLLVDVLVSAPVPSDMGAPEVEQGTAPDTPVIAAGPAVEIALPGIQPRRVDPRTVFVSIEAGKIYLSVPLRNVGRGLAVIDRGGVEIEGPGVGSLEYRTVQRHHVPVNETTRIELITGYRMQELEEIRGPAWRLSVPYTDFAGDQRTVARLRIVGRGEDTRGPWYIERVEQESLELEPSDRGISSARVAPRTPDRKPKANQPPDAGSSPSARSRRQQVTDIWGNPIVPRGGRSR